MINKSLPKTGIKSPKSLLNMDPKHLDKREAEYSNNGRYKNDFEERIDRTHRKRWFWHSFKSASLSRSKILCREKNQI